MEETTKPGYKTTEFWLSLIGALTGIAVLLGFVTPEESTQLNTTITAAVGGVMSVISIVGYAITRAKTKTEGTDLQAILDALAQLGK